MGANFLKKLTNLFTLDRGQALIEIVLTIAIAAVILIPLSTGIIISREAFGRSEKSLEAQTILQKEIEAIRSIRENSWNSMSVPGTYHVEQSENEWVAISGSIPENDFTRSFEVESICRTSSTSDIIDCSNLQAIDDPSTKKISAKVSWSFLGIKNVSSIFYLTRYFGNQTWLQTSRGDFDAGTFENTSSAGGGGGLVQLSSGAGSSSFIDEYENSPEYTFDPNKIEVVGGFAQLKAQGSTVSGSTVNSGFDSGTSNWSFAAWGNNVSQTGSWQSSGGNPGGLININLPTAKNKKSGGYWYQPFTTTINNPTSTLTFDWRAIAYDPSPDSFRLYAFVDTGSGTPDTSQAVWDSGEITNTTSWSSTVTVDVSSRITTPGTYYLKVAVFVDYQNKNRGPYTIGYDNVSLDWSGSSGSYPTDEPSINRNISFSAPSITAWNSFTETAQANGGSIQYQLSDDDGATWKFFNGSSWVGVSGPNDYNDANTIDSNISSFSAANNKINAKTFLISNGSQQVQLDRIEIGYSGASIGTFTSSTFDAGDIVGLNRLFWTENAAPSSSVELQIAVNTDNSTWVFVGPDNTANTFFTGGIGIIPLEIISGRYFRYKIFFTSTSADKPKVEDVTINYSP